MKTSEEIAIEFGLCRCDVIYTSRGMKAPDCPWHSMGVEEAMKEYANLACEAQRLQDDEIAQQSVCDECRINVHAILNAPLIELK